MHFKQSKFRKNYAKQGGTFYIQDRGFLILEDVEIDESSSMEAGGAIYASSNAPADMRDFPTGGYANWIEINIMQTPALGIPVVFGGFNS